MEEMLHEQRIQNEVFNTINTAAQQQEDEGRGAATAGAAPLAAAAVLEEEQQQEQEEEDERTKSYDEFEQQQQKSSNHILRENYGEKREKKDQHQDDNKNYDNDNEDSSFVAALDNDSRPRRYSKTTNKSTCRDIGECTDQSNKMDDSSPCYPYQNLASPRAIAEAAYKAGIQSRKKKDDKNKKRDREDNSMHRSSNEDTMNEDIHIYGDKETITTMSDDSFIRGANHGGGNHESFNNDYYKRRRLEGGVVNNSTGDHQEEQDGNQQNRTRQQRSIDGTIDILQDLWQKAARRAARGVDKEIINNKANKNVTSTEQEPLSTEVLQALEETKNILFDEFDNFIRTGLSVFNERDDLALELSHYKDLYESTNREVQRLKSSEEASRASLSNLLKAVETSKASARDAARAAQTEARLRGEVSTLRSERDVVIGEHAEARRKVGLLEEEVRLLKSRIARLTQDKIKVERDARAALSLARSMDSHAADDVEYYKRRVNDLNDHLQSKNMQITELKNQVEDLKRQQINRSFGHNRMT